MPDFTVRSDAVNVEQIMEQIRARIAEKRGVDYTDAQIRELASVKLEKFLDPRGVRSDLLEQYRRAQPPYAPPELPNYAFEADTLFESTRGPLRLIRKLLMPVLKLFFNPNPLIQALHIQAGLNTGIAEREAKRDAARYAFDQLHYEVMHNLVVETTRLGIEVKNITMRLESLASRLEFNERRARALESVVVYKPATENAAQTETRREDVRRDEPRRDDARRDETRRDDGRREDARRDDARRRDEPRRDEGHRHDGRRQESRRPDAQRTDQQRADPQRPDQPRADAPRPEQPRSDAPRPEQQRSDAQRADSQRLDAQRPDAQPSPSPNAPLDQAASAGQADAASTTEQTAVAGVVEGPGQRSRRRRRRRGRRGGGSAAAVMGGDLAHADASADGGSETDRDSGSSEDDESSAADTTSATEATSAAHERAAAPDSRTARPEPFEHTFGALAHPAETTTSDPTHSASSSTGTARTSATSATSAEPAPADPSATPEQ